MNAPRRLEGSPSVLFIVYTPGADAEAKGYHPWLVSVDNPFFNAIPGVHHYANWKLERTLAGGSLAYTYFDFQGLVAEDDLERVWFNPDLDAFRTEWIRLWGYGTAKPTPMQSNAYVMRPSPTTKIDVIAPRPVALITAGLGTPPPDVDLAWRVEETIRKHFAIGRDGGPWRVPANDDNPLGLDWVTLTYGESPDALAALYDSRKNRDIRAGVRETTAFIATLIAAPD